MKILITGVAGMIGSVLARYFLSKGDTVIGLDNLSGGSILNIPEGVSFFEDDILDCSLLDATFAYVKPDYVIHCACFAAECLSPFIRNFISQNIVVGTENVINCCINNDVKKIIHFSSIARYGDIESPFRESDIPRPKDCYGIYKLTNEMSLEEARKHFGLSYSIVSPHNVLSPAQNFNDPYRNVAAIFIRKFLEGKDLEIYGDGSQTRCFSDAKYLCDPIEKLLTVGDGELFNLGSDNRYTIKELAQMVIRTGKILCSNLGNSNIIYREPRLEVQHAIASHSRAKDTLNFKDDTDLDGLIKSMFEAAVKQMPFKPYKKMSYEIEKGMYSYWK